MTRVSAVVTVGLITGMLAAYPSGGHPTKTPQLSRSDGVVVSYHGKAVQAGQVVARLPHQGRGCASWKDDVAISSPIGTQAGVDLKVDKSCRVIVDRIDATTATLAACGPAQYSGDVVQLSSGITMAQVTSFQKYYWNCGNLLTYDTSWASCYAFAVTYQVSPCQDWFVWYYGTAPSSAETHGQGFVVYSPGFGGGQSGWIWVNFEVVAATWRLYANCGWDRSMGDYFHCGIH